jgi:nucleoside-diphosphate-sugar epimerase
MTSHEKVAVTGGTGMIGSHLVRRLLRDHRNVVVSADLTDFDMTNLQNLGVQSSQIEFRRADLADYSQALAALKGVKVVYHLAARVGSLKFLHSSESAELSALQANLAIDAAVFRACLENGVETIVYASSCAVYPMSKQHSYNAVFAESSLDLRSRDFVGMKDRKGLGLVDPDGGYGWSKLMGEVQLNLMKHTRVGIARIYNIYGENEPVGDRAHAVGDFIVKAIRYPESNFVVRGNGKQTRDYLHVSDCVEALVRLEKAASNPPVTVNVGSGQATSIASLAQKIVAISGKNISLTFDGSKDVGPRSRTADVEQTQNILGWKPEMSLDKGLYLTYSWLKGYLK